MAVAVLPPGAPVAQPAAALRRLEATSFAWRGSPESVPPRVTLELRRSGAWHRVRALVPVTGAGATVRATWRPGVSAPRGTYRIAVRARSYRVVSAPTVLGASRALRVVLDRGVVRLRYPPGTAPAFARQWSVRFNYGRLRSDARGRIVLPAHTRARFANPGDARDAFGNVNGNRIELTY